MKECTCRVCRQAERVEQIKAKLPVEDQQCLDALLCDLEYAETSATYWEMKFNGTWPEWGAKRKGTT